MVTLEELVVTWLLIIFKPNRSMPYHRYETVPGFLIGDRVGIHMIHDSCYDACMWVVSYMGAIMFARETLLDALVLANGIETRIQDGKIHGTLRRAGEDVMIPELDEASEREVLALERY